MKHQKQILSNNLLTDWTHAAFSMTSAVLLKKNQEIEIHTKQTNKHQQVKEFKTQAKPLTL